MYKVNKLIDKRIHKQAFFFEFQTKLRPKYFIDKIEQGIREPGNMNYQTNVLGGMTAWNYFAKDMELLVLLKMLTNHLDQKIDLCKYVLDEAWGIRTAFNDYTKRHSHDGCVVSGILYLSKSKQYTYFPELDEVVKPMPGKVVLFSPMLDHYTKPSLEAKPKYAIPFNYKEIKDWNNNRI